MEKKRYADQKLFEILRTHGTIVVMRDENKDEYESGAKFCQIVSPTWIPWCYCNPYLRAENCSIQNIYAPNEKGGMDCVFDRDRDFLPFNKMPTLRNGMFIISFDKELSCEKVGVVVDEKIIWDSGGFDLVSSMSVSATDLLANVRTLHYWFIYSSALTCFDNVRNAVYSKCTNNGSTFVENDGLAQNKIWEGAVFYG